MDRETPRSQNSGIEDKLRLIRLRRLAQTQHIPDQLVASFAEKVVPTVNTVPLENPSNSRSTDGERAAASSTPSRDGKRFQSASSEPSSDRPVSVPSLAQEKLNASEPKSLTNLPSKDGKGFQKVSSGPSSDRSVSDPSNVEKTIIDSGSKSQISFLSGAKDPSLWTNQAEESELILRRLVAAEESWDKMKPYALDVFEKWPRPEIAAKISELVYMHGNLDELVEILEYFRLRLKSFYFLIDHTIREFIVMRLWLAHKEAILNHFLHQKTFQGYLVPLEHFFVFWSLYAGAQDLKVWKYFQKHRFELQKALTDFGRRLKLSSGRFYLTVGRLAYEQKEEQEARRLLEKIHRDEPEFKEALDLLVNFAVELDEEGLCVFGRKLKLEKSWQSRIRLFEDFFNQCQRMDGVKHQERNALNQILLDPLKWLPQNVQAWHQLSSLIVKKIDLAFLLPNLVHIFESRRFVFENPAFEKALWEPLMNIQSQDESLNYYWKAFALIHQYIATSGAYEISLWEARSYFHLAAQKTVRSLSETWADIHGKILRFISRSSRFDEEQRQRLILQVKITGSYLDVQADDIYAYLSELSQPNYEILSELQNMVRQREDWKLEVDIIRRLAHETHYRNEDLARLWELSRRMRYFDLSWRVISVLEARRVLHQDVGRVWALTSERRHDLSFQALSFDIAIKALSGLKGEALQLAQVLIRIGPLLPELLSLLSKSVKSVKKTNPSTDTERELDRVFQKSELFPTSKRKYLQKGDADVWVRPPFADILPENRWMQVFTGLVEQFGLHVWKWQISYLYHEIEGLLTKLNRSKDLVLPSRVGKWLRSLTPSQRKSWYEMGSLARRISDEQSAEILGMVIARLSTVMCGQHIVALDSLATMGASLPIRWDLERFILCGAYSEVRKSLRSAVSLEIPESLPLDPRGPASHENKLR